MLPSSLRYLCLCLAALITIFVAQSECHQPFSRRGTLSFSARHRFARRSSHLIASKDNPSPATSNVQSVSHQRRSIEFDDNYPSQSLDQERVRAEKLWEEFIESTDGDDVDFYPDCDDDEQSTSGSHTVSSPSDHPATTSSTSINDMSSSTASSDSKAQNVISDHHENNSKPREEDKKPKKVPIKKDDQLTTQAKEIDSTNEQKEQEAAQAKKEQAAAEAKKQQEAEAESKKEQEAEAKKEKEAEAKKENDAEAKKEQDAEAKKEQDAEAKKEQDAEAKKEQDAEAKKEQDAEDKKQQDAEAKKAKKGKEEYSVTDLQKIPGTSVTTGTAHRPKDETNNFSPSTEQHIGDATYFTPDTGACGYPNTSSDFIVAVSHLLYDSFPSQEGNPNTNTICHRMIRATYEGKSVDVKVMDRCEGCAKDSLDFTQTAFQQLAPLDKGRLHGMTWTFI